MNQTEQNKSRSPFLILGVLMTVAYLILGALFIFTTTFFPSIESVFRTPFGAMLMMYGAFRGWKVYDRYYANKQL